MLSELKKMKKCQKHNGAIFGKFYPNSGYLYLSAGAVHYIEGLTDCDTIDVYLSPEDDFLLIHVNPEGEYILSKTSSGAKVCLYGSRHCGIEPGSHDLVFIEDMDGLKIKVDYRASEGA